MQKKYLKMTGKNNIKRILKERAKKLQGIVQADELAAEKLDILEFILADERYAVELQCVTEVVKIKELTPLPCTPSFIKGIINKRGQIISVIDIKKFFNLPEKGISNLNRVIVVKHNDIELGILCDEVVGTSTIDANVFQNNVPSINKIADNYVMGVSHERLIVLDIQSILLDEKIIVDEIV